MHALIRKLEYTVFLSASQQKGKPGGHFGPPIPYKSGGPAQLGEMVASSWD